jgi:hypothetical protein
MAVRQSSRVRSLSARPRPGGAAQLLVQGLQLLALAFNDFATCIFASYVAELHQHLVPALGIGCAGHELYAAVVLRTGTTGRMSSYSWCKPRAAAVKRWPWTCQIWAGSRACSGWPMGLRPRHIQPLAPGGSGHEQQPLGIPECTALAGAAQQIDQMGGRNGEKLMTAGGSGFVNVFCKS